MRWNFWASPAFVVDGHPSEARLTEHEQVKRASWDFESGTSIAEGRSVVRPLGGGSRYEVYLV